MSARRGGIEGIGDRHTAAAIANQSSHVYLSESMPSPRRVLHSRLQERLTPRQPRSSKPSGACFLPTAERREGGGESREREHTQVCIASRALSTVPVLLRHMNMYCNTTSTGCRDHRCTGVYAMVTVWCRTEAKVPGLCVILIVPHLRPVSGHTDRSSV